MSILVMSDIHGNLPALKAVLRDAETEYSEIWVLGDVVGYGPDPGPCLDLIKDLGAILVAGNHDWAVCGMIDVNQFNNQARAAIQIHKKILSIKQQKYLASLPIVLKRNSVTLCHANPLEPIWGYVMDKYSAESVLRSADTSLTLIGHSHITAMWSLKLGNAMVIPIIADKPYYYADYPHLANPGSVGQSRNGDPAACYMLLDPIRKTIIFRKCRWHSGNMAKRMREQGYPESLTLRMTSGH